MHDRTQEILSQISAYTSHKGAPDMTRAALLVIDMQEWFTGIAAAIVPQVNRLVDTVRAQGRPVIFTRHGHRDLAVDGGVLADWWHDQLAMVGTPAWQLISDLDVRDGDPIIDKTRYSAFYGTWLEAYLRRTGISDILICGVMTNCCCETTARDAFMRDFRVFVAADATATECQDLHVASLKSMSSACAIVSSVDELAATA